MNIKRLLLGLLVAVAATAAWIVYAGSGETWALYTALGLSVGCLIALLKNPWLMS